MRAHVRRMKSACACASSLSYRMQQNTCHAVLHDPLYIHICVCVRACLSRAHTRARADAHMQIRTLVNVKSCLCLSTTPWRHAGCLEVKKASRFGRIISRGKSLWYLLLMTDSGGVLDVAEKRKIPIAGVGNTTTRFVMRHLTGCRHACTISLECKY